MASMTKGLFVTAFLASTIAGLHAQSDAALPPMPPLIATARTAFLSYEGSECSPQDSAFSGPLDRGFDQFSAGARSKLHYAFVDSPASADLVLAFRSSCNFWSGHGQIAVTRFRVTAYDTKTHVALWTFFEQPRLIIGLQKTRDTQFDIAITNLVDDVVRASSSASVPGGAAEK